MKFALNIFILFFIFSNFLHAQNSEAYLIPRRIYVGDPAALVVPLPAANENFNDIILTKDKFFSDEEYFPFDPDIDFHKIILEKRTAGSRLLIEFTAFVPGVIEFPDIEIGGEKFSGLSVTINSLIEGTSDRVLSGTASALAMPGTALMLYGTIAILAFLILLVIWFLAKGRAFLHKLNEKWKRKKLFTNIRKTEKHLNKAVNKGIDKRIILDKLSDETREFLSVLTDSSCRAMTAREFDLLPVNEFIKKENLSLCDFFQSCDELRFSGADIENRNIFELLDDLQIFIDILEKPKENNIEEKAE